MYTLESFNLKYIDGSIKEAFVLLPPDYSKDKTYKVLYMHDGQNVFFKERSLSNYSWGIKEVMEKLTDEGIIEPFIVAALSHGEVNRTIELTPFKSNVTEHKTGNGDLYADFFVNTFVREIENRYSVSKKFTDKGVLGSSLGGLMSAYLDAKFENEFSKIGVFSLASWISKDPFINYIEDNKKKQFSSNENLKEDTKYYIYVGSHEIIYDEEVKVTESNVYINDSVDYLKSLIALGVNKKNIKFTVGVDETHSEKAWNNYLEDFIKFMEF